MLPWHHILSAQGVSPKHFCSRVGYFGLCICPSTQGVYVICLWVCMTHAVSPKTILPLMLLQALVYPTRWTSAAVSNFCCGKSVATAVLQKFWEVLLPHVSSCQDRCPVPTCTVVARAALVQGEKWSKWHSGVTKVWEAWLPHVSSFQDRCPVPTCTVVARAALAPGEKWSKLHSGVTKVLGSVASARMQFPRQMSSTFRVFLQHCVNS